MAIKIINSELNKDYVHEGIHRLVLNFKGESLRNCDNVNILLRSKVPELICFVEDGKEHSEIRFSKKFSNEPQVFEKELAVKQLYSPEQTVYAGFLISGRNSNGNTASEEFVLQCK
jgi:hypothetical protein